MLPPLPLLHLLLHRNSLTSGVLSTQRTPAAPAAVSVVVVLLLLLLKAVK
jgi:hypothetical protein